MPRFKNIQSPDVPASQAQRKGKKSVSFKNDPEILARLVIVGDLMLEGKSAPAIAATLKQPLGTTKRDIARVRQLWREESKEAINSAKVDALNMYKLLIRKAWGKINDVANLATADKFMTIVLRTQARIDKITGLEVENLVVSGPQGGPVQVQDIDSVRDKRWKTIEKQLQEAVSE
jgi:hypothetical protein